MFSELIRSQALTGHTLLGITSSQIGKCGSISLLLKSQVFTSSDWKSRWSYLWDASRVATSASNKDQPLNPDLPPPEQIKITNASLKTTKKHVNLHPCFAQKLSHRASSFRSVSMRIFFVMIPK